MAGRRFCYRCGRGEESGPLIDGLCPECYSIQNPLAQAPREVRALVCRGCGSHLAGRTWRPPSGSSPVESAMVDAALSALRIAVSGPGGMRRVPPEQAPGVEVEAVPLPGRREVRITVRGRVHELQPEVREELAVGVRVEEGTCSACRVRRSGRFEAILQVRGELDSGRISEVRDVVEKCVGEAAPHASVVRVVELREGLDFYINPSRVAREAAMRLKGRFGAEVKESAKLVGQTSDGRRRYRTTFLVRL